MCHHFLFLYPSAQANTLPTELHLQAHFPYWRLKYMGEIWLDFLVESVFSYGIQIRERGTRNGMGQTKKKRTWNRNREKKKKCFKSAYVK